MGIVLHIDIAGDWFARATDEELLRELRTVARVPQTQIKGHVKNNSFSDAPSFEWDATEVPADQE